MSEARMSTGRILWRSIVTFLFPGYAQARYSVQFAITWFVLSLVAITSIIVEIRMVYGVFVLHAAGAVEAFIGLRRRRTETLPNPVKYGVIVIVATSIAMGIVAQTLLQAFRIPSSSMVPTLAINDHVLVNKLPLTPSPGEVIVFHQPCQPGRDYVNRIVAIAGDTVEVRCTKLFVNGEAIPEELVNADGSYVDEYDGKSRIIPAALSRSRIDGHSFELFHKPGARTGDFPLPDIEPPNCVANGETPNPKQRAGTIVVTKPGASECEKQAHFVVPPGSLFVMGDSRENSNDSRYWGVVPVENVVGRVIGIHWPVGRIQNL